MLVGLPPNQKPGTGACQDAFARFEHLLSDPGALVDDERTSLLSAWKLCMLEGSPSETPSAHHVGDLPAGLVNCAAEHTLSRSHISLVLRQIRVSTRLNVGAAVVKMEFGRVCSHCAVAREARNVLPVLWADRTPVRLLWLMLSRIISW